MTSTKSDPGDNPGATIVPIRPDLNGEVIDERPADGQAQITTAARALVARWQRPIPSRRRIVASVKWWAVNGGHALLSVLIRLPQLALAELRPVLRGLGTVTKTWADWMSCTEQAARIKADDAKGGAKGGEHLEARKSGRRKLSLITVVLAAGGAWWFISANPDTYRGWVLLLIVGALVVFDLIGRRGVAKADSGPVFVLPSVLAEWVCRVDR